MLRHLKTLLPLMLVMAVVPRDSAFTIWGPAEAWQTTALDYMTRYWYAPNAATFGIQQPVYTPGNVAYTELGAPKDRSGGSRINVGVITYAYDYTFLQYYGAAGMKAVDSAFAVLNRLPAASSASANLTEFITDGNQQINYTARALSMLDLKSVVLQLMMEQMGLLGETHVFDLEDRGGLCGAAWYDVIVRNFDPVTWNPTTYVNGTDYGYEIRDGCPFGSAISDALENANGDIGAGISTITSAVATQEALQLGGFYLGLTRDDVGGLRYLYRKNNFNNEAMPTDCYIGLPSTSSAFVPFSTNISSLNLNSLSARSSPFAPPSTNAATNGVALTNFSGGLLGGVEKITFVKVQYPSLIGATYTATNLMTYTIPFLTNNMVQSLLVVRSNTKPDIIFSAANLLLNSAQNADQPFTRIGGLPFIAPPGGNNNAASTPSVSEVLQPTNLITFNDVGPLYVNEDLSFKNNSAFYLYPFFQFGSFDGSTNAPIAFPQGTSLNALLALELTAPAGQVNSPFNPLLTTNTLGGLGTTGGTVGVGGGGGGGAAAAKARPAGANSPMP